MKTFKRTLFLLGLLSLFGFSWPFSWLSASPNTAPFGSGLWLTKQMQILKSQAKNIDDKVLSPDL